MKYRLLKGYKYELLENVKIALPVNFSLPIINTEYIRIFTVDTLRQYTCVLLIKKHYTWDGASFLTIDTKSSMRGSLAHDALYQLMREELVDRDVWREDTDELLRDICIEDGMWEWRADMWYFFVRQWGKKSSMPRKKPRGKIVKI